MRLSLGLVFLAACSGSSAQPAAAGSDASTPGDDAAPDAAAPACPEGVAFTDTSNKVVIDVKIDGTTYKIVYDTGAPNSVFDASVQQTIGGGVHTIELAGKSVRVPITFMSDLGVGAIPGVVGIIGSDFAGRFAVSIDYPRSRFWLDDTLDEATLAACAHVEDKPTIVDAVLDYYVYVPGQLESKDGWFLLDTGASFGAVPKSIFAELDAAKPRPALPGFYTPAAVGTFWAQLSTVGSMETGGQSVSKIVVRTIDDGILGSPGSPATAEKPLLGLLPHDYLAQFLVTVDFPRKKVRFDAAKTATRVGPTQFLVAGIGLEEVETPPIHVARVLAGSSAADQGIVVGDEIVSIGGTPIAQIDVATRPWKLVARTNAPVAVTVSHGGVSRDVMLDMRDLLTGP
jgi:hypothetical protein